MHVLYVHTTRHRTLTFVPQILTCVYEFQNSEESGRFDVLAERDGGVTHGSTTDIGTRLGVTVLHPDNAGYEARVNLLAVKRLDSGEKTLITVTNPGH